MVMTLVLDLWETLSLTAGCNLYSKNFRFCVLTVKKAEENRHAPSSTLTKALLNRSSTSGGISLHPSGIITASSGGGGRSSNMYFRERDKPVVDADTFLATSLPQLLMAVLIIFLNVLAIVTLIRSSRWMSSIGGSFQRVQQRPFYFLPQSTQGLLHSLFLVYFLLGALTFYSQVSLSAFVLAEFRFVDDQGSECLFVNCAILALSISIVLHLVSLAIDRTLASYLTYAKYTQLAKGTVPLWLLAIWLPSGILGALPLAGWRTSFSFCIFIHQFNDDYLRFVSGFYFSAIVAMPCLYFYFLTFLRPTTQVGDPPPTLYRWHRKLQSHHRLTFVTIVGLNIVCWTPFHLYLLLACLTCPFPGFGSGFFLEYLYIIALVPAIAIPMMFTIRSSVLDQCAAKISRCVSLKDGSSVGADGFTFDTNPLSRFSTVNKKSPLFYIDEFHGTGSGSSSMYRDTLASKKGNFFVPRYLPMQNSNENTQRSSKYIKNTKNNRSKRADGPGWNETEFSKFPKVDGRGERGYQNKGYENGGSGGIEEPFYSNGEILRSASASTQETDSQCGFPINSDQVVVTGGRTPALPERNSLITSNTNMSPEDMNDADSDPYYSRIISNDPNDQTLRR